MPSPRILIFDSGVGGLSIVAAVAKQHPHCSLIYASDNAYFPYGTKPENELIERVDGVLHKLQSLVQADIVVVACNTASTVALAKIRERFSIPIVGVVPAIKPAAILSQSHVIGLMATPGTIKRPYTRDLIKTFAGNCHINGLGCSELVKMAEQKLRGQKVNTAHLDAIVQTFAKKKKMDTVILACTHFPLLKMELQQALPNIRHWVDSGDAIARRVGYWLRELKLPTNESPKHACLFTANDPDINALSPYLNAQGLGNPQWVDLEGL